jgi:hypothetical protein
MFFRPTALNNDTAIPTGYLLCLIGQGRFAVKWFGTDDNNVLIYQSLPCVNTALHQEFFVIDDS